MAQRFLCGLDVLLRRHKKWIAGRRVGLVSHLAATTANGMTSAERLWREPGVRLAALFGPEHGFFGLAGAGETVARQRHPAWRLPMYSLYGAARKPTPAMLRGLDTLIVDLQDLGARPYTYGSTLRTVLEAAAAGGQTVIVADRPIPLPRILDGPPLDPAFASFVGLLPAPMCYGMTPGETALWLRRELGLSVDLRVAPLRGYRRQPGRDADWPPWIPPSPGIRAWETARCYLSTVFTEAMPHISNGRGTALVFQVVGAPWIVGRALCERLEALRLPGAAFYAHPFQPTVGPYAGRTLDGVRIVARDPAVFHPVRVSVALMAALQTLYGRKRVWAAAGCRPDFFDRLYGGDTVRKALEDGETAAAIAARWQPARRAFARRRRDVLLYPPRGDA